MQQRAQDAPHMGVVVNDQETKLVEIDPKHGAVRGISRRPFPWPDATGRLLRKS
jgi:hypothetical protein